MFCPFRPRYACTLATLGLSGLLSSSACDSRDPCQQLTKDYADFTIRCGYEPPDDDGYPDGCTEPIARQAKCYSQCLEDAPCEALEPGTTEQIELESCGSSCLTDGE